MLLTRRNTLFSLASLLMLSADRRPQNPRYSSVYAPNPSAPIYDSKIWEKDQLKKWAHVFASGDTLKLQPNCYAYATQAPYLFGPGRSLGWQIDNILPHDVGNNIHGNVHAYRQAIRRDIIGAQIDGLRFIGREPKVESGTYLIAYFRLPPTSYCDATTELCSNDFHFMRQDRDGTWSQKFGQEAVTDQDDYGRTIYDPRTLKTSEGNQGNYEFIGFFLAPEGGLNPKTDFELRPNTGEDAIHQIENMSQADANDYVFSVYDIRKLLFSTDESLLHSWREGDHWAFSYGNNEPSFSDDTTQTILDPTRINVGDFRFRGLFRVPRADLMASPR